MAGSVLGIHQPNFLPWPGYFIKLACSDQFIFLEDVIIDYYGYARRCKINGGTQWLTVALQENKRKLMINNYFVAVERNNESLLKEIKKQYNKSAYFSEVYPYLESILSEKNKSLANYNADLIKSIASRLKISSNFYFSSELNVNAAGSEKIKQLCMALNTSAYLSGISGKNYLDFAKFKAAGIQLKLIDMKAGIDNYLQSNKINLKSEVSIIEWLFSIGFVETSNIIKTLSSQI